MANKKQLTVQQVLDAFPTFELQEQIDVFEKWRELLKTEKQIAEDKFKLLDKVDLQNGKQ